LGIASCSAGQVLLTLAGVTHAVDAVAQQDPNKLTWQQRYPNWFNLPEDKFIKAWSLTHPVAIVNGEQITAAEVANFLWEWGANNIINTLMVFKMIDQEAQTRKIHVTRAEVLAQMEESFKDLRTMIPPGRTLEQELMARNQAWSRVYLQVRATIQLDRIIQMGLDPRDLVHSAQIVVRIPGNTPDEQAKNKEETLKAAQEIADKIRGGMAWDDAVNEYSEDPFTKNKGGDLGWRWREELDPKFAEAVFKLKPGEIADPIETTVGYQIIRCVNLGANATPEEYETARSRVVEMKRGMLVRELQDKAEMENLLVPVVPPGTVRQPSPGGDTHDGNEHDRPADKTRPNK
jgi:foldase protein PrsA